MVSAQTEKRINSFEFYPKFQPTLDWNACPRETHLAVVFAHTCPNELHVRVYTCDDVAVYIRTIGVLKKPKGYVFILRRLRVAVSCARFSARDVSTLLLVPVSDGGIVFGV